MIAQSSNTITTSGAEAMSCSRFGPAEWSIATVGMPRHSAGGSPASPGTATGRTPRWSNWSAAKGRSTATRGSADASSETVSTRSPALSSHAAAVSKTHAEMAAARNWETRPPGLRGEWDDERVGIA